MRSALGDRSGLGVGDVAQKHEHALEWDYLVELLGEELLAQRVDALHAGRTNLLLDERDVVVLDTAVRYRAGVRPGQFLDDDNDDDALRRRSEPSPEARAEERLYGAATLLHLLGSVVAARRKVARDRLSHMVDREAVVPEKVVARLIDIAVSEDAPSEERVAAIDLVRRTNADGKLVTPISQRIGALYHEHADRAPNLLDALDHVPLENDEQ